MMIRPIVYCTKYISSERSLKIVFEMSGALLEFTANVKLLLLISGVYRYQ